MTKETAVIVGVGGGLGAALVRRAAKGGMAVVASARGSSLIDSLAKDIEGGGGRAMAMPADATDETEVAHLFSATEKTFGVPDLVVFNAGAYRPKSILETTAGDVEECFRIGCLGGFLVGREAARRMVARGTGTILFTGATASLRGSARYFNLAVGKFALRALAQSMARELGPKGIHVAHIVVDGQIVGPDRSDDGGDRLLSTDAMAETYWQLHRQHRSAWTHELDLRPWVEKF